MNLNNFQVPVLQNYIEEKKCKDFKENLLVIDSRDRNTSKYPNPADYTIDLPRNYNCIHKVELVNSYVKGSTYNIIEGYNDTIYITTTDPTGTNSNIGNYASTDSKYPNGIYCKEIYNTNNKVLIPLKRSDFTGRYVLLWWYPKADTPG